MKRKRTRDDVVMPLEPPHSVLRWLAGDPLILAASDEQALRRQWGKLRARIRAAKGER